MDIARQVANQPINLHDIKVSPLTGLEQAGISKAGTTGVGGAATTAGIGSILGAQQAAAAGPNIQQFFNPYQSYVTDEILRQGKVFESAGMANALKRGVLNVIPPLDLTRSKKNFQSFIGEETGKKALELTQRLFVAANTFSEKYPIKEQELLADMFPTGSPFREGKVT